MNAVLAEANINLRAPVHTKKLIDQAACVAGKSRTAFMLDASYEKAQELLADQTSFVLDANRMRAFNALLDAPLSNIDVVARLLAKPAPWEI